MDAPPPEGVEVEEGVFSGYGAVFSNIDSGGDVIEPGAFTKTLAENNAVKIFALHKDDGLPIGIPLELREDANGLWLKAKISDTSTGRDVKTLIRDGVLDELSIGYEPVIFEYDGEGVRHLREVRLHEVSVVTWAMNPEAQIVDYKALQRGVQALQQQAASEAKEGRKISGARLKALKECAGSMKVAYRAIAALIREAEGEKSRQPPTAQTKRRTSPALPQFKNARIKITY